jgi:Ni/Co efflux regulator RcnB
MSRVLLAFVALSMLAAPATATQPVEEGGKWKNVRCNADGTYDCDPAGCLSYCCP